MDPLFLLLAISVVVTSAAQLLIKKGVLGLGKLEFSFINIFYLIPKILQNIWLVGGLFLFGVSFLLWMLILSRFNLNVAYPIVISLNFSLITIASWFLFKEYLSLTQILGIGIIIVGIFLVISKGI